MKFLKEFIILFPVAIVAWAINSRSYSHLTIFFLVQVIEIVIRLQFIEHKRCSTKDIFNEISWKIASPRIFLPLFTENFVHQIIFIEICNFFALRRFYHFPGDASLLLFVMFATYRNFINKLELVLILIAFFSRGIQQLFHSYEISFFQSTVCCVGIHLVNHPFPFNDPFSAYATLLLGEFALAFLFLSIYLTYHIVSVFKITDKLNQTLWFAGILLSLFSKVVWHHYAYLTQTNPLAWFYSLFTRNNSLGGYFSLYWIFCIAVIVWFADYASSTLRLNRIITRKIFHLLVVAMFLPALLVNQLRSFVIFALFGALGVFVLLEYTRAFFQPHILNPVTKYFNSFILEKERKGDQIIITSHISLLIATASTIWLHSLTEPYNCPLLPYLGMITVGIGDASAACVGLLYGGERWSHSNKTIVGSIAAFLTMFFASILIVWLMQEDWKKEIFILMITSSLTTLAEVFIEANDNIVLPLYSSVIYICLKRNLLASFM